MHTKKETKKNAGLSENRIEGYCGLGSSVWLWIGKGEDVVWMKEESRKKSGVEDSPPPRPTPPPVHLTIIQSEIHRIRI